jgi:hypothetical protein
MTGVFIFMASRTSSRSPAATVWPTLTGLRPPRHPCRRLHRRTGGRRLVLRRGRGRCRAGGAPGGHRRGGAAGAVLRRLAGSEFENADIVLASVDRHLELSGHVCSCYLGPRPVGPGVWMNAGRRVRRCPAMAGVQCARCGAADGGEDRRRQRGDVFVRNAEVRSGRRSRRHVDRLGVFRSGRSLHQHLDQYGNQQRDDNGDAVDLQRLDDGAVSMGVFLPSPITWECCRASSPA